MTLLKKRRGLSEVVAGVIIMLIFTTAITYTIFSMDHVTQATENVEIRQTLDFQKTTEEFEVTKVETVGGQFSMTVINSGEIPIHLTRLWVENTTDSTWPIAKYDLDVAIFPGNSATNIGQSIGLTALDTQSYEMKLVSERGNTEKISLNSVNNNSVYLNLRATPTVIPTGFSTTLVLDVINTGSNKLLNLQAEMDPPVTSCSGECIATGNLVPSPTSFDSLDPGDIATFEWVYTIDADNDEDNVTFTARLVGGVDDATAVVTIKTVEIAENANVSFESQTVSGGTVIDDSILVFHEEQESVPNGGYQMISVDADAGSDGTRLPPGGVGGTMTHGTFTFDADNDSDEDAWTWTSSAGSGLFAANTERYWSHEVDETASSGVGPQSGQGCTPACSDGYVYTEMSSPGAFDDLFDMEFNTNLDASTHSWEITFYHNQRGDDHDATVQVEINENGGGWTSVGSQFGGSGDPAKVNRWGNDVWTLRTVDLSNSGANTDANTDVRILITMPSSGTEWHNDAGIDTVTITGTPINTTQEILPPVSFMTNYGTNIVSIPAGIWNASLFIDSAADPIIDSPGTPNIKYHMEESGNPDNSIDSDTSSDLTACVAPGAWCDITTICNTDWANRFEITIDNTKVSGSSNHSNFPMLVHIKDTDFTDNLAGGDDSLEDIRFTNAAGNTLLDYEIVKYDKITDDELIAWVEVPTLDYDENTVIYMYFDNAGSPTDRQDADGTWNSNYLFVGHMNDASTQVTDSSGNDYHLDTVDGTPTYDVAGKVGAAITYDGSSEGHDDNNSPLLWDGVGEFTAEVWFKSTDTNGNMMGQRMTTGESQQNGLWAIRQDGGDDIRLLARNTGGTLVQPVTTVGGLNDDAWHYAVASRDSSNNIYIRVDGGNQVSGSLSGTLTESGNTFSTGRPYLVELWDGELDEARVSDVYRGNDWTVTSYNNQNSPSTFYSLTVQSTGGGGSAPDWRPGEGPHGSAAYYYDGTMCHRTTQDVSSSNANDVGANDATTSLWFKTFAAVSSEQMLIFSEGLGTYPSSEYYKISIGDGVDGTILYEFDTGGVSETTCQSGSEYDDGEWYNVIGVRDTADNTCDLYIYDVNGVLEESVLNQGGSGGTITHDGGDKMYVGSNQDGSNYFNGYIDDIFHWNTVKLNSTNADTLARVNHGTAAHKFDVSIDVHDTDGNFLRNEYSSTKVLPYHDPKHYNPATDDSALGNYNITMSVPAISVSSVERLNFTMAFQEASGTWEPLVMGLKIDDDTLSPHSSFLQFPTPDNPFPNYLRYDPDDELILYVENIGVDGIFFIYSGTRLTFDNGVDSFASHIRSVNGTDAVFEVDEDSDSIYIPSGDYAELYFHHEPNDHPCKPQPATASCPDANIIPDGQYRMAAWINGYSDQGESFGRSLLLGNTVVEDT